jgi:hypothetical protein
VPRPITGNSHLARDQIDLRSSSYRQREDGAGANVAPETGTNGFTILDGDARVALLTGDIRTDNDTWRLSSLSFSVKQITNGRHMHLDARMIERGLADLAAGTNRAWVG